MPKAPKTPVRAKKLVHPNSRQAMQMQKQSCHDQKVLKSRSETAAKQDQLRQKLLWFQEHMDQNTTMYTKHELADLAKQYLKRFEDEMEQIGIINSVGNRQGKQHVSREAAINITLDRERREFEGVGLEVPDLVNGKNLEYFRNWTGEVKYFPNIKLRKAKQADIDKAKAKPTGDTDLSRSQDEDLPDYVESD